MQQEGEKENNGRAGSDEVTLVFELAPGGEVKVERAPKTNLLQQVVNEILQRLGVQQPRNVSVQRKDDGSVLDLTRTLEALGLKNGDRLLLAWQVSGGSGY